MSKRPGMFPNRKEVVRVFGTILLYSLLVYGLFFGMVYLFIY